MGTSEATAQPRSPEGDSPCPGEHILKPCLGVLPISPNPHQGEPPPHSLRGLTQQTTWPRGSRGVSLSPGEGPSLKLNSVLTSLLGRGRSRRTRSGGTASALGTRRKREHMCAHPRVSHGHPLDSTLAVQGPVLSGVPGTGPVLSGVPRTGPALSSTPGSGPSQSLHRHAPRAGARLARGRAQLPAAERPLSSPTEEPRRVHATRPPLVEQSHPRPAAGVTTRNLPAPYSTSF